MGCLIAWVRLGYLEEGCHVGRWPALSEAMRHVRRATGQGNAGWNIGGFAQHRGDAPGERYDSPICVEMFPANLDPPTEGLSS